MEHRNRGVQLRARALMLVFLILAELALVLADEDFNDSDDSSSTPDLTTNTSLITLTERHNDQQSHDFQNYDEAADVTTNVSLMPAATQTITKHVCQMEADPGPCTAELIKFFYDSTSQRCRQFIYGGCDGNENNFVTEDDCLRTCSHTSAGQIVSQPFGENDNNDFPTDTSPDQDTLKQQFLTLAKGRGETSFTFSSEYPFIQLKAVDISEFRLRYGLYIINSYPYMSFRVLYLMLNH